MDTGWYITMTLSVRWLGMACFQIIVFGVCMVHGLDICFLSLLTALVTSQHMVSALGRVDSCCSAMRYVII